MSLHILQWEYCIKGAFSFSHPNFRAANTIATIQIAIHKGTTILSLVCLVLCLNSFNPSHEPMPPPNRANHNKVRSLILNSFRIALFLSIPYRTNAIRLIIRRYDITMICVWLITGLQRYQKPTFFRCDGLIKLSHFCPFFRDGYNK